MHDRLSAAQRIVAAVGIDALAREHPSTRAPEHPSTRDHEQLIEVLAGREH